MRSIGNLAFDRFVEEFIDNACAIAGLGPDRNKRLTTGFASLRVAVAEAGEIGNGRLRCKHCSERIYVDSRGAVLLARTERDQQEDQRKPEGCSDQKKHDATLLQFLMSAVLRATGQRFSYDADCNTHMQRAGSDGHRDFRQMLRRLEENARQD